MHDKRTRRGPNVCPTRPLDAGRLLDLVEELAWYALRVAPQKEFVVQEILTRKGTATYCPSDRRWRRNNRFSKKKDLKSYPLMPGYVFAGFIPGIPSFYDLRQVDAILGCIGFNGEPKRIPKDGMRRLIGSFRNGLQRPTDERFMQTYKEFKAGDLVRLTSGPFDEMAVPVLAVEGAQSRVLMNLFGANHEVIVPTWTLEPAA